MFYYHTNLHLSLAFYTFLPTAINRQTENIINPLSILRKNISNMLILLPTSPSQTWPCFPNLLPLQSCLCSAAGSLLQIASLHLCSPHPSGDLTAHYCNVGKVILLLPSTQSPNSSRFLSQDPFVRWFNVLAVPTGFHELAQQQKSSTSTKDGKQRSGRTTMTGVQPPSLGSSVLWYCMHSFISPDFILFLVFSPSFNFFTTWCQYSHGSHLDWFLLFTLSTSHTSCSLSALVSVTQVQSPTSPSPCSLFSWFLLSCCTPLPCR